MLNVVGELLNSKTEWHQPKIVRTTIHNGGAEFAGGRIISFPQAGSQTSHRNETFTPPGQGAGGPGPKKTPRRSTRRRNA